MSDISREALTAAIIDGLAVCGYRLTDETSGLSGTEPALADAILAALPPQSLNARLDSGRHFRDAPAPTLHVYRGENVAVCGAEVPDVCPDCAAGAEPPKIEWSDSPWCQHCWADPRYTKIADDKERRCPVCGADYTGPRRPSLAEFFAKLAAKPAEPGMDEAHVPTPDELDDLMARISATGYASEAVEVVEEWTRKWWGVESADTTQYALLERSER